MLTNLNRCFNTKFRKINLKYFSQLDLIEPNFEETYERAKNKFKCKKKLNVLFFD